MRNETTLSSSRVTASLAQALILRFVGTGMQAPIKLGRPTSTTLLYMLNI